MTAKSLLSTSIGNLRMFADTRGLNPDKLRIAEALKHMASRDTSRGGGPLTSEDEEILERLVAGDTTLTECIATAHKVVKPGRKFQDVIVCVVDENDPRLLIVDKPGALN